MDTQSVSLHARTAATFVRVEMHILDEYCQRGNRFFERELKKLEKDIQKNPSKYDDDQMVDEREELLIYLQYNTYFGILMTFSALEQFLKELYDYTRNLATVPELREVILKQEQPRLTLERFKDFFATLGIKIAEPPYEWGKLLRLQAYRNAVVHQGGSVTPENVKRLVPYRIGQSVAVSIDELRQNIRLVRETADRFATDFTNALEKVKAAKTNSKKPVQAN
jgi:hypothetical protein